MIIIVVGGSGLYVDAILKGFDEFPEIDASTTINTNYEKTGNRIFTTKPRSTRP
jgi:tRNA dimethylallyltransferase